MDTGFSLVLVTVGSPEEGEKIGRSLVEKQLAVCVNLIPGMTSIYKWKGEIEKDTECLLVIKTKFRLFLDVKEEVLNGHSYDLPEIIELPIQNGFSEYLDWIDDNIKPLSSETII